MLSAAGQGPKQEPISVIGFSGSTHRPSKTRALIEAVLERIEETYGAAGAMYDLMDAPDLGSVRDGADIAGASAELIARIQGADVLVVGSPVYKGSYSGLFKHLFDLLPQDALAGKPVVLTASGGGDRHALVVEHQMRPLFGFFTAQCVATAIYASEADFADGRVASAAVRKRIDCAVSELRPWMRHPPRPTDATPAQLAS